jgi:Uma2 family endonuclease
MEHLCGPKRTVAAAEIAIAEKQWRGVYRKLLHPDKVVRVTVAITGERAYHIPSRALLVEDVGHVGRFLFGDQNRFEFRVVIKLHPSDRDIRYPPGVIRMAFPQVERLTVPGRERGILIPQATGELVRIHSHPNHGQGLTDNLTNYHEQQEQKRHGIIREERLLMSTVGTALTTWDEFVELPDPEDATHYELHDGEVVVVPTPKPIHVYIQNLLMRWLTTQARGRGYGSLEFPYRPAANLQYWYADVAYLPNEDWRAMRTTEYQVYAPPLVIEVLSPSNRPEKIRRQRVAAFSGGTREFWVVDPVARTVEVSLPGSTSRVYSIEESVPVAALPGATLPVRAIFED